MSYPYQSLNHLGQITNVNNKWFELTGYSKDEVINQNLVNSQMKLMKL